MTTVRELVTKLSYDLDNRGLTEFENAVKNIGSNLGAPLARFGALLTASITVPLTAFAVSAVSAAEQSKMALTEIQRALTTTGGAAGRTAEQLQQQAEAIMKQTMYDDEQILAVSGSLIKFGNISGQQFDRAQQAIVDYAGSTKRDLGSSAMVIGRALANPAEGMKMLGRAGIVLTAQQKTLIKNLAATGHVGAAQNIILGELEKKYAGGAKAAADASSGTAQLKVAMGELAEQVGMMLLPYVRKITDYVRTTVIPMIERFLKWFDEQPEAFKTLILVLTLLAVALGPILTLAGGALMAFPMVLAGLKAVQLILPAIAGALVTILIPAIIIFLFVDDFLTMLRGGDSVLGTFAESFWKVGDAVIELHRKLLRFTANVFLVALDQIVNAFRNIVFWAEKAWGWISKIAGGALGRMAGFLFEGGLGAFAPQAAGTAAPAGIANVTNNNNATVNAPITAGVGSDVAQQIPPLIAMAVGEALDKVVRANPIAYVPSYAGGT